MGINNSFLKNNIMLENSVQVLDGIQAIFFKVVIMKKKFAMLYQLLQFHCLDDSLELAEVLIKLGMKDKSNFEGKTICAISF